MSDAKKWKQGRQRRGWKMHKAKKIDSSYSLFKTLVLTFGTIGICLLICALIDPAINYYEHDTAKNIFKIGECVRLRGKDDWDARTYKIKAIGDYSYLLYESVSGSKKTLYFQYINEWRSVTCL